MKRIGGGLKRTLEHLRAMGRTRRGQGLVEYGLILVLIAVICVTALRTIGQKPEQLTNRVTNALR